MTKDILTPVLVVSLVASLVYIPLRHLKDTYNIRKEEAVENVRKQKISSDLEKAFEYDIDKNDVLDREEYRRFLEDSYSR